eukprot:TCALIF_08295-PA protein Name:"Protein of unknown function" AED:0.05 eAED:0.05 QI:9/1/0.5/1/0/0/2/396/28
MHPTRLYNRQSVYRSIYQQRRSFESTVP